MSLEDSLDTRGEWNDSSFGELAIRPTFAVDHQPVVLPVEVVFGEVGQFRHPQAGIQERPDDEFFCMGVAGVGQSVGFIRGERFPFVLGVCVATERKAGEFILPIPLMGRPESSGSSSLCSAVLSPVMGVGKALCNITDRRPPCKIGRPAENEKNRSFWAYRPVDRPFAPSATG
jgi:hypothetical protein